MRKRQFGKGRLVSAEAHNLAQDYMELNLKELASDSHMCGLILIGGSVTPHALLAHTITIEATIARTSTGDRILISTPENFYLKPTIAPGVGNEMYVTVYATYTYQQTEQDVDSDLNVYYKDYQNGYTIAKTQGSPATTGNAVKPSAPYNSILICDILYDNDLYNNGQIDQSDIDTTRQDKYTNITFDNITIKESITSEGTTDFKSLEFTWETGKMYTVGEMVTYGTGIYKCTTQHTSGGSFASDLSYWTPTNVDINILTAKSSTSVNDLIVIEDSEASNVKKKVTLGNINFDHTSGTNIGTNTHTQIDSFIASKAQPEGLASLDSGGKVYIAQLPDTVLGALQYKGTWDCSGGSYPVTTSTGDYYISSVTGTIESTTYNVGDWLVYNGSSWDKVEGSFEIHASRHISEGIDEIDGDKLDIDWNPSNYVATSTGQTTSVDELSSHLNGIDLFLGSHDHYGGDGAQIDHITLSNKGTNTHTDIDNHIINTSNPHDVLATQITDFDTEVSNNSSVVLNTSHRTSTGADHTYINQDVTSSASPSFAGLTVASKELSNYINFKNIYRTSTGYTILDNDGYGIVECNGNNTIYLPTVADNYKRVLIIKNTSTGIITIDGEGSETIDGSLTYSLNFTKSGWIGYSNGIEWKTVNVLPIIDEDTMSSDSNIHVPTQQSVKAFVDNKIIDEDTMVSDSDQHIPTQQSVKAYVDTETAPVSGEVLQKIIKTDTGTYTTASSSYAEITSNWQTAITPKSATSKIILSAYFCVNNSNSEIYQFQFYEVGVGAVGIGAQVGSNRRRASAAIRGASFDANDSTILNFNAVIDSSGTTQRTFTIYASRETTGSGTLYVNYTNADSAEFGWSTPALITIEEIAQ